MVPVWLAGAWGPPDMNAFENPCINVPRPSRLESGLRVGGWERDHRDARLQNGRLEEPKRGAKVRLKNFSFFFFFAVLVTFPSATAWN